MVLADLRKVQRTPSGTFFVCLPKAWAQQYGLDRGSVVSLGSTSDGKLLIDPEYGASPSQRTVVLKPGPYLGREIIGKYLLGFDIIRVESRDRISFEVRETVKSTVGRLVGLEIVEEDHSAIVLQCLIDLSGFPPDKILRRGYAIAAGMHRDSINALVDGDLHLAKSIMARDDEVNRLYFLLVRILRTVVQNPGLSQNLGVSPIDCLDYRLAASFVEALGDECVRIASKTAGLRSSKLADELKRALTDLHTASFEAHENALKAFFVGDMKLAEDVREIRTRVDSAFGNIEKMTKATSLDAVPHILGVASILRQIYEHGVDIADLVMPKKPD